MRIISFLFLYISCLALYSQEPIDDYRPFIEEGKVWMLTGTFLGEITHPERYIPCKQYIQGDTMIAGRLCKKWMQEKSIFKTENVTTYTVYAYEENKKVWFFHEGDSVPRLLFDFGASEGDTIIVQSPDGFIFAYTIALSGTKELYEKKCTDTLVIAKRGEQEFGGQKQRCIWYYNVGERYDQWSFMMEGIGSSIKPNWNKMALPTSDLLTCTVGDEILFWESYAENWGLSRPSCIYSPQIVNGKSVNRKCYDLTGRRLSAPPTRGVYIEGGEVRIRK